MLEGYIIDLAWSPDGKRLAVITSEGLVYLIHQRGKALTAEQVGCHANGGNALSWCFDGEEFASAGHDGLVKIWDGQSGQQLCALEGGDPWVTKVAYSPDSKVLASSASRHLKLWDQTRQTIYASSEHDSTIADLAWNPDGSGIAVAAYNGLTIHAKGKQKQPRKYKWKGSSLALAFSPDAKYIASGEQDCTVHFWNRKSGEHAQMWGFPTKVLELSWDYSGRWLATGGGAAIGLWDCGGGGPEGTRARMLEGHLSKITQLAFACHDECLASSDTDAYLFLWEPFKSDSPADALRLTAPASCLVWSQCGKLGVGQKDGGLVSLELNQVS